jgi:alkanesulfonate monooxygenase SsuD/methylene tetrahydromethanopterin reductase-like flavin-dependent oxidoreductase (luciferase family)
MRFGLFYELQIPKPWEADSEQRVVHEAIEQVVLADRIGIDYAWATEHHFLEEYAHCSASEVFLSALAAKTERIRIGFGIRQVIPAFNHPARTAEAVAMLDLISNGRVEFGIGEGATGMELGGFSVEFARKRALAMEAAEQIANMMVMCPYPGYEGEGFSFPARNIVPKPLQKPHPPMWMACTSRSTIEVAARSGLGALAFSFLDPEEAQHWAEIYYSIICSEECVPLAHSVNANIAMVAAFSLNRDRTEAISRGIDGFRFFNYAMGSLVRGNHVPGQSHLWQSYLEKSEGDKELRRAAPGIGTPEEFRELVGAYDAAGVDQVIFLQQGGKNSNRDICDSLELFGEEVLPGFKVGREDAEAAKAKRLAPYIEAALDRKQLMKPLEPDEIPIVLSPIAT